MKDYQFNVEVVLNEGRPAYELTIYRGGELDQGPRLYNDISEVLSWIDHQLEMSTEDLVNAHR